MWEWLQRSFAHVFREVDGSSNIYARYWRMTTNKPLNSKEKAAVEAAFTKFEEGFEALDKAFGQDWRWR